MHGQVGRDDWSSRVVQVVQEIQMIQVIQVIQVIYMYRLVGVIRMFGW